MHKANFQSVSAMMCSFTKRTAILLMVLALVPLISGCSNSNASGSVAGGGTSVESGGSSSEGTTSSSSATSGGGQAEDVGVSSGYGDTTSNNRVVEESASQSAVPSDLAEPVATVKAYFNAMNDFDVTGMFACCDSQTNALYDSLTGLLDALLGSSTDEEVDVKGFIQAFLPSLMGGSSLESGQYDTFHITPRDFSGAVDGDWALVECTCDVTTTINGEEQTYQTYEEFTLVKQPAGWKIYLADQLSETLPQATSSTLDFFLQ